MKYENKERALSLIREIENQEKIIEQVESLRNNLNQYSISICAVNAYDKIYISLDSQQLYDLFINVIRNSNEQIKKYKKEIESL